MNSIFACTLRACLAVLACCASALIFAQSPDASELTLTQAIAATLARNPQLQSSTFALRAADSRIAQADLSPNPELSLQLENFGGSGELSGVDALETTLMLSQVLELGGKREARGDSARASYSLLSVEDEARRLDLLAEVTRRFIHVASDQQQLALTARATALAQKTLDAVRNRVDAAKSPEVELHRAQIALTRARLDREHAEHELKTSKLKLAVLWGDERPLFTGVRADLYAMPQPDSFAALVDRLQSNPNFTRFTHEQRLRDAEIRLAETRRSSDIQIGAGIRQLQASDDHAFVASFSMPLFAGSRSRSAIAEATARRSQIEFDQQAAFLRARAQLFELYQELRHALTEVEALRTSVLPQTESILQQTEQAYRGGRYSYLDWVAAQREVLEAQRSLIDAAANAHRYFAEIERLTGEPLAAADTTTSRAN